MKLIPYRTFILCRQCLKVSENAQNEELHQWNSDKIDGSSPSHPLALVSLSMVSVTCSQLWPKNTKWKIARSKQFRSLKLCTALSSMMTSFHYVLPGIPNCWHHLLLTSNPWHDHGSVTQDHRSRWTFWWHINSSLTLCRNASVIHSLHLITLARYDLMSSQVQEG